MVTAREFSLSGCKARHSSLITRHFWSPCGDRSAFTLIEMLVVITIIIILMGLLFPAFRGAQDQAKKAQAKNDVTQIITAINAFYTEYGQYPCGAQGGAGSDSSDYFTANDNDRKNLMDTLRVPFATTPPALNPRGVVFLQPPVAKDLSHPKAGIGGDGVFYDPWGKGYRVRMDNGYNGTLTNPYSANAGFSTLNIGVIAWSFGKDGLSDADPGPASDKKSGTNEDDVISWQ